MNDVSRLITQLSKLYDTSLDSKWERQRWKEIELIASKHVAGDFESYEDKIVHPVAACVYFLHLIMLSPDNDRAWRTVAQIADSEVRRLSL